VGVSMSGDDTASQRAKCDIHRWISAAHFFGFRAMSPLLRRYSATKLAHSGVLTFPEVYLVRLDKEPEPPPGAGAGLGKSSLEDMSWDENQFARDKLLSWVALKIQKAVGAGLMHKDASKETLARLWHVQKTMGESALMASQAPKQLPRFLVRISLDVYAVLLVLSALTHVQLSSLSLLPWAMLKAFIEALCYDALCQTSTLLSIGVSADSLDLDAIILLAERETFVRISKSYSVTCPERTEVGDEDTDTASEDGEDGDANKEAQLDRVDADDDGDRHAT